MQEEGDPKLHVLWSKASVMGLHSGFWQVTVPVQASDGSIGTAFFTFVSGVAANEFVNQFQIPDNVIKGPFPGH